MTRLNLQTLASVAVILTAVITVAFYIYNLEKRVERLESQRIPSRSIRPILPIGTILPYVGTVGVDAAPAGWVLCGEGETPNLDGRFLVGTNSFDQVRQQVGSDRHLHGVDIETTGERNGSLVAPLPERADNHAGQNWDHKHNVGGDTELASHIPPSVTVMFFCRVR